MERARLARVFGHGLGAPVGCVLPLRRAIRDDVRIWQSAQVVLPRRHAVPAPGRFTDRLPAAAGQPALGETRTRSNTRPSPIRSPRACAVAAAPGASRRRCRPTPWVPAPRGSVLSRRSCRSSAAASRDLGAHRALRRAARRHDPRVLPAAVCRRGLAGARRRGRGHRRRTRPQGGAGGLPAAARSAPAAFLGHARSRRDRGQRASRIELDGDRSARRANCTRRRARSAWPRKSSCSTAATSAPAAATTW